MNILDKIIEHKRVEVAERKKQTPVSELEKQAFFSPAGIVAGAVPAR